MFLHDLSNCKIASRLLFVKGKTVYHILPVMFKPYVKGGELIAINQAEIKTSWLLKSLDGKPNNTLYTLEMELRISSSAVVPTFDHY